MTSRAAVQSGFLGAGAALMVSGAAATAVHDAMFKHLLMQSAWGEAVALRCAVLCALILVYVAIRGDWTLLSIQAAPKTHLFRTFVMLGAAWCYTIGIALLPLTVVLTLTFVGPIFVACASALILGERLTNWGIAAIGLAFCGVLLIVRPVGFGEWAGYGAVIVFPLLAAAFGAARDMTARVLRQSGHPLSLVFWPALLLGLTAPVTAAWEEWQAPSTPVLGWSVLIGGFALLQHLATVRAFAAAPAPFIAPFRYAVLPIASVIAYLVWDQRPVPLDILGAAAIVCAGLMLLRNGSAHVR